MNLLEMNVTPKESESILIKKLQLKMQASISETLIREEREFFRLSNNNI